MSDLSLNEYNTRTSSFNNVSSMSSDPQKSQMVAFLIKKGIVKDEKTGNMVLTIFAVVLLIISFIMMKNTLFPAPAELPVETTTTTETESVTEDSL